MGNPPEVLLFLFCFSHATVLYIAFLLCLMTSVEKLRKSVIMLSVVLLPRQIPVSVLFLPLVMQHPVNTLLWICIFFCKAVIQTLQ